MSRSVSGGSARPFYGDFGWAYDQVVATPEGSWVAEACAALDSVGIGLGAKLLDAGCGTGRYAAAFHARGYDVDLVDGSPELLSQAVERLPGADAQVADLRELNLGRRYDGIVCRGVLNDLIRDEDRQAVLDNFAAHVRTGGAVVLDVRDQDGSERRYRDNFRLEKVIDTPRGTLTFRADGRFEHGLLYIHEQHELRAASGPPRLAVYDFTMRPWTHAELDERVRLAGFQVQRIADLNDRGSDDRLLCLAILSDVPG
ncbi:Methyltransferase domain-containing protein [Actinopolymorpha cephalotaxi]|uniref:Methyltransferase domain-containing protein n=1 Tax=Actinopolymorpha cephalotaxi TaxID=504797 RepID=A0A1I2KI05_9ACTN|nr:class I SAM-dependent methyltransferase [Actinopolymorpha cephalotaxi]NYH87346.1 SAM-dependent methyltransferase [Actinopolymorpha cephalotaxi]SFF64907.1 Methyltransferase domain-containing protein [Actinopolymorpha cephalotaxi]